jgi:hypothetical protein
MGSSDAPSRDPAPDSRSAPQAAAKPATAAPSSFNDFEDDIPF